MSDFPSGPQPAVLDESEETYCYNHKKTPTRLRCSRCNRPICGRCAIPASVGQHCPECVAAARKATPRTRRVSVSGAPAVYAILAINAVVFVIQQATQTANGNDQLLARFAGNPLLTAQGEWYRLLTPMLLHLGILHIALNSLALYFIGPAVEHAFGTRRFVLMYVVTGFTGNVASYMFGSCAGGAGASGAIFGILGVLLVYTYQRRSNPMMNAFFRNILFWIGVNVVFGLSIPNIDIWAHAGGLAGGMVLAAGFDAGNRLRTASVQAATTIAVVGAGVVLAIVRTSQILAGGRCGVPFL